MPTPIPFLDLPRQLAPLVDELAERFQEHVARAAFVGGPAVVEFEDAFAEFCGVSGCVGVANGTEALMLALMAAGVNADAAVVVPAYTFIATAEAVSHLGAKIVLADVDPRTGNLSVDALRNIDDASVKAVIPVHLYGQPADLGPICNLSKSRNWTVIEDCAQAHGALYDGKPVGSFGTYGAFSFYPTKNLGALGDAGAVVGSRGDNLERLRRLANHGRTERYLHAEVGVNSRLDAIQAMALNVKLGHLHAWNIARQEAAEAYTERLSTLSGVTTPHVSAGRSHVFHLYTLLCEDRAGLAHVLEHANIGFGCFYETPLHLQPAYAKLGHARGDFPHSEYWSDHCLSLPLFPGITEGQIDQVCDVITEFCGAGT